MVPIDVLLITPLFMSYAGDSKTSKRCTLDQHLSGSSLSCNRIVSRDAHLVYYCCDAVLPVIHDDDITANDPTKVTCDETG